MPAIERVTLAGPGGRSAQVITLGARLQFLSAPDRQGRLDSVVLGFSDRERYRTDTAFVGAVIGRYANRIAHGRTPLDGRDLTLDRNEGPHHLHGGACGFDTQHWTIEAADHSAATLRYVSPDGEGGYPGTLTSRVRYAFDAAGTFSITLTAQTDAPTLVNLSHHAYFNLAGMSAGATIREHWLQIPAARFTPTDAASLPLGTLTPVAGTPFDFRTPKPVGRDLGLPDPQLEHVGGYDHNWVIDDADGSLRPVATLFDPASGRVLRMCATAPGLQCYTGNALPADPGRHAALCLEPQLFPDSPNQPGFPSARLAPGRPYHREITLALGTAEDIDQAFG